MCGRYACAISQGSWGRWQSVFTVILEAMDERYNIAPSSTVDVYTRSGWHKMKWGLVPSWSKEPKTKYSTFNARVETLTTKPMFRSAWSKGQRCLIPISGYYEWKNIEGKKIPFYITSKLSEPLVLAGLWDKWEGVEGVEGVVMSCSIITLPARGELAELHGRMPVMLDPDQASKWLEGNPGEAYTLLEFQPIDGIRFHEVSRNVGNPRNQGHQLILPVVEGEL